VVAQSPEPGAHVTNTQLFNSTMNKDQNTKAGTTCPTLYDNCVGSLTSPDNQNNEDAGHGATAYCPRPIRLEYLTICRCHCIGSIFSFKSQGSCAKAWCRSKKVTCALAQLPLARKEMEKTAAQANTQYCADTPESLVLRDRERFFDLELSYVTRASYNLS